MTNYYELNDTELKKGMFCIYEIWDGEMKQMRPCGKAAYGKKGLSLQKCLCKEHYEYACLMIK